MREKGTDFSIARTRYTVNKQKFLQHPMVKRISALAEDEQRKGCRPGNEGKAPPGTAHLMQKRALIAMQYSALHHRTWKTPTVQKPCSHGLQNKKAMKSFDFTAFSGAMEGTRTPGLLIRSQSLYPAELPTHTFRSEHDVFYHEGRGLSTAFLKYFYIFQKRTSFL